MKSTKKKEYFVCNCCKYKTMSYTRLIKHLDRSGHTATQVKKSVYKTWM